MNLTPERSINKLFIIIFISLTIMFSFDQITFANSEAVNTAKNMLKERISKLSRPQTDTIEIDDNNLTGILQQFSGLQFTFEELFYEILTLSKDLNKTITVGDSSTIFNRYKTNIARKLSKFDSMEYRGNESSIIFRYTPNTEDEESYVEVIDNRDNYYAKELLLMVSLIQDRNIKARKGMLNVEKVFVNNGLSFKFRKGDERVDSDSVLGIMPKTETILILEGDLKGEKLEKGTIMELIARKYGGLDLRGDYIDMVKEITNGTDTEHNIDK